MVAGVVFVVVGVARPLGVELTVLPPVCAGATGDVVLAFLVFAGARALAAGVGAVAAGACVLALATGAVLAGPWIVVVARLR